MNDRIDCTTVSFDLTGELSYDYAIINYIVNINVNSNYIIPSL